MFGIVRPAIDLLSEEDKKIFKAYYCGICKSIAKRYTSLSRMTLSYDCTFLAIFLDGIEANNTQMEKGHCVAKSIDFFSGINLDVCSDINVLLMYYKLSDDVDDENNKKARILKSCIKKGFLKAKDKQQNIEQIIKSNLDYLYTLEKAKCNNPDEVSDAFGMLLFGIMKDLTKNEDAAKMAYNLGKYIYLLDAFMDYNEDVKKGRYNVFYEQFGKIDDLDKKVNFNLEYTLSQILEHYKKLEIKQNKQIIENVLYAGLIQYFNKAKGEKE